MNVVDNSIKKRSPKDVCIPVHPQSPRRVEYRLKNLSLRPPWTHYLELEKQYPAMESWILKVLKQIM